MLLSLQIRMALEEMKVQVISNLDLATARRNKLRAVALKVTLTVIVAMAAMHAHAQVEYVDPTIGNVGVLLVPTRPAVGWIDGDDGDQQTEWLTCRTILAT